MSDIGLNWGVTGWAIVALIIGWPGLLVGAVASFLAVAAVMYFTRRIDWYGSLPVPAIAARQTAPEVPRDTA